MAKDARSEVALNPITAGVVATDAVGAHAPTVAMGVRDRDPRPPLFQGFGYDALKGDRAQDALPPSKPLTGPLPFTGLSDGRRKK